MKLRSKILSYTLPLILIPLIIMALATYYFIIRANQVQTDEETKRSLNEVIVNIGQEANSVKKDIEVLSKVPALAKLLTASSNNLSNGTFVKEEQTKQARTVLELFFDRNPYYLELSLVDANGEELMKLDRRNKTPELLNLNSEGYFRRTLITGETENPIAEKETGLFVSVFARSVRESKFLGMVVLKLDARSFVRSMRPLLNRDFQTFLFDDRGLVFATSLHSETSGQTIRKLDLSQRASRILDGSPTILPPEKVLINGRSRSFSILPAKSFAQIGTLEKQEGSNWFLGILQPEASSGIASSFQIIFFSTLFLAIAGVLWAASSASRRITVPLERVSRATTLIARGQTDLNLDVQTGDEVGDLADAVAKMNGELQDYQKRLVQSTKLATIGEMTSEISHEIQNRISGISLWLQHLDSEIEPDDPKREYLDEMKQGLGGFMEMLASLKDYYQSPVLNLEPIDINHLVSVSLPFVQEKLNEKQVVVKEKLDSNLSTIEGDFEKLKGVVLNLLINAADSLENGGEIEIMTQDAGSDGICLEISDNGKGISEKDLSRIFYPFFSTKSGGSGLGLSICSNIISAHKGRIEVESEIGKGTSFKVVVPQLRGTN